MLSELDEVLDKLTLGQSFSQLLAVETTDTSGEENDTSQLRRKVHSIHTLKKKSYATEEIALFSVTGSTDDSNKFSELFCSKVRKDVPVLLHASSEVLR